MSHSDEMEDFEQRCRLALRGGSVRVPASFSMRDARTILRISNPGHQQIHLFKAENEPIWPENAPPVAGGRKDDGGKARHDLLAPEFLTGTAEILAFGAAKYGDRNWEKGMSWSRPFAAMMRHMWAWWGGEQIDPETGKSHLWHASCCLMFLVAYEQRKSGTDDRPNSA